MRTLWAAKTIEVGKYPLWHIFGLAIDANVVASTLVAFFVVVGLFALMRRKVTSGVPNKLQLIFEIIVVDTVGQLAESAIGEKGKKYVPLGVTILMFILACNWLNVIPTALHPGTSYDILPAPTGNINLPLAMALFVIVWVHIESIRARRVGGYFKHYFQPYFLMTPINVIEELTKPITLTLRLFGNVFAGAMMVSVMIVLVPPFALPFLEIWWRPFDGLLLGSIQAYIFMLLTILYFGMATSHEPHSESHDAAHDELSPALSSSH